MSRSADVQLTVDTLFDMGVLNEEGCARFAEFVRGLQALPVSRGRDRAPRKSPAPQKGWSREKKFFATEAQLRQWYLSQNMSARAIGEQHGVSAATVIDHLRKYGIKKRGTAAAKTKGRKKAKRK